MEAWRQRLLGGTKKHVYEKTKVRLDSDRPSHGRRLHSSRRSLPSILNNDTDSQCGGNPTNRPPKMQIYRMGDCAPFAPVKMKAAARKAKPMKKMPTLVGTGFSVIFTARLILSRFGQLAKAGVLASLRRLFAFLSVNKRYGDVTTAIRNGSSIADHSRGTTSPDSSYLKIVALSRCVFHH